MSARDGGRRRLGPAAGGVAKGLEEPPRRSPRCRRHSPSKAAASANSPLSCATCSARPGRGGGNWRNVSWTRRALKERMVAGHVGRGARLVKTPLRNEGAGVAGPTRRLRCKPQHALLPGRSGPVGPLPVVAVGVFQEQSTAQKRKPGRRGPGVAARRPDARPRDDRGARARPARLEARIRVVARQVPEGDACDSRCPATAEWPTPAAAASSLRVSPASWSWAATAAPEGRGRRRCAGCTPARLKPDWRPRGAGPSEARLGRCSGEPDRRTACPWPACSAW